MPGTRPAPAEVFGDQLAGAAAARRACVLLLPVFAVLAFLVAPFTFGDQKVWVPWGRELDAVQECLLVGSGVDKLQLRVGDVDLFELLRWTIVFTSLAYAYLLYRALGIGLAISVAGAVLCATQPGLANGILRESVVHPGETRESAPPFGVPQLR